MRDPRALRRWSDPVDALVYGREPSAAAQMVAAAAPPPTAASRMVEMAPQGGAWGPVGVVADRIGDAVFSVPPLNLLRNFGRNVSSIAAHQRAQRQHEMDQWARQREMAPMVDELALLELEEKRRAAQAQTAQAGVLDERVGAASGPEREALIRGRAGGPFRPFGIEPGPAELAAYENVLGMEQEEARQKLIAQREERQAQLAHQLSLAEIGARGRQEVATEREKRALGPEAAKIGDVRATRAQFEGLGQPFSVVRGAYKDIQSLPDTKVGDLTLLVRYMKMIDPTTGVKEGELASADNAGGVPAWLRAQYNRFRESEGRLAPEVRADFKARAEDMYRSKLGDHRRLEGQYREIAIRNQMDPRDVVTDFVGPDDAPAGGLTDAEKAELEALEKRFGGGGG